MKIKRCAPVGKGERVRRRISLSLVIAALGACVGSGEPPAARVAAAVPRYPGPVTTPQKPREPAKPVANPPIAISDYNPRSTPSPALVSIIQSLGRNFNGKVGIAVRRVDADWTVAWNGTALFPQQSVSKLWVTMAMLDAVDRGKMSLSDPVTIHRQDLTLFNQPLAAMVDADGFTTTVADLMKRAMAQSDNTANDMLLRKVGGPEAVRGFLARRFVSNVRFGPGERILQSTTAGLSWNPSYAQGRNFYAARAALPMSVRQRALDAYLADPPDGAAPSSVVAALAKLKRGEMLSPASTSLLLDVMHSAKTGPQRIKGGVPPGWSYLHKTGTGQELAPRSTGFNDIGIMTAPDGTSYAVAVFIGSTTVPIPTRWELMQSVAKAVAANHDKR
ncbi:MAG: class A beta-lactamase-related serine hydrolase [Sphingobium sp.]|uniref:serine hydrolase n=1 Tax=Sphingobium sp. TaxID=1912891 RepID=UPI0029A124CD|nr:serine hydrolase [Sphingobium sp.]MDX3910427.1 class A beta-lactamase-related serine hydrolase [Sphingobium sp.]